MHYPGHMPVLMITDMDMVKEIALCTSLNLGKPSHLSKDKKALLGQGILTSNGLIWLHQRKIIAPEFYLHKVKVNLLPNLVQNKLKLLLRKLILVIRYFVTNFFF